MELDENDPMTWPLGIYTCHTEGCDGEDEPVQLRVPAEDPTQYRVICGACGIDIEDRRAAADTIT